MKGILIVVAFGIYVALSFASTVPGRASLPNSSVGIVRFTAKNDPVQILSCDGSFSGPTRSGNYVVSTRAFNRYNYDLVGYEVHYRFFDVAHHLVFEQTWTYDKDLGGDNLDVAAGDQTAASGLLGYSMDIDNMNLISSLDCKVVSAKFADSSMWKSDAPWHGKVYHSRPPGVSGASTRAEGGTGPAVASTQVDYATVAGLKATVLATWHSQVGGDQWVHIRFVLSAKKTAVISADDVVATMNLEAGGTKTYVGMTQPAPLVPKGGQGTFTPAGTSVPAVSGAEDLGTLGSVTIGPGVGATVVVTFHVPDELNPSRPVQSIAISAKPN